MDLVTKMITSVANKEIYSLFGQTSRPTKFSLYGVQPEISDYFLAKASRS